MVGHGGVTYDPCHGSQTKRDFIETEMKNKQETNGATRGLKQNREQSKN